MLAGNSIVWNMEFSQTDRCLQTRRLVAEMIPSLRSSVKQFHLVSRLHCCLVEGVAPLRCRIRSRVLYGHSGFLAAFSDCDITANPIETKPLNRKALGGGGQMTSRGRPRRRRESRRQHNIIGGSSEPIGPESLVWSAWTVVGVLT